MYSIIERINAAVELLKRYSVIRSTNIKRYKRGNKTFYYNTELNISKEEQRSLINECFEVCVSKELNADKKRAARVLLEIMCGKQNTNTMLEGKAIVLKRGDPLVRRWRNKVIERDKCCQKCGSDESLHAHHISRWIDDPINRINLDNGISLCQECHVKEHPLQEKLLSS